LDAAKITNDLTFFTNEPGATLQDRFSATRVHIQHFAVLVGHFRTIGFHLLANASLVPAQASILRYNISRGTS
jgi:hypothetical protein